MRTPDGFEQSPDYGFTLSDVEPAQYAAFEGYRINNTDVWDNPFLVTLGRDLEEETITSHEVSYFGQFPMDQALLSLEVRVFREPEDWLLPLYIPHELVLLISGKADSFPAGFGP